MPQIAEPHVAQAKLKGARGMRLGLFHKDTEEETRQTRLAKLGDRVTADCCRMSLHS